MNIKLPILSICIPTYNRAKILKESLESLVCQDIFQNTNQVEIIISDNCSTDNTSEIVDEYIRQYGSKIKYFCNQQNVKDKNFGLALSRGQGIFRKLSNDTLIYQPNSLRKIVEIVNANQNSRPILFFSNNKKGGFVECDTMDKFISMASFQITWLGGFGLWNDELGWIETLEAMAHTYLAQTYVLLKQFSLKKKAMLLNFVFCKMYKASTEGSYNISEVFIKNYLSFFEEYVKNGELSNKVFEKEKWLVLKKHVLPRIFNVKYHYRYDKTNFWQYTKDYHKSLKFYLYISQIFIKKIKQGLKNVIKAVWLEK